MEANKKEDSSSESSSGSTSDSSTSSSSSSGSESSSSSDSDSSSSQASTKVADTKKAAPVHKNVKRNSETTKQPQTKQPQANIKQDAKPPTKQKPVLPKSSKPTVEIEISSSDDEDTNKSNSVSKHSTKKKTITKPKSAGNINKPSSSRPPSSKVIPKSQQSSGKSVVKTNESPKNPQSKNTSSKVLDKDDPNKKKSIFSPENSSEDSESTAKGKLTQKSPSKTPKKCPRKTEPSIKKSQNPQKATKTESNPVSSEDGSSSDSSSSDSDSSGPSVKRFKKDDSKPNSSKQNQNSNSDSDNDTTDCKKTLRKSTRSANTRKSKHVLGKNVYSDTDSDTESTKRSSTQSPVKKAPSSSKGKAKKKSENIENIENNKSKGNDILVEERSCPLDSCNSLGHISGKFPKHFTLEACPMYHNKTVNQCKEEGLERKKREENRKKVLEIFKKAPKATILQEQKQNLQKIREARAKFEYLPPDVSKITDNSREPNIDGFVPDYDLQLFKDAQAIAAEKIEEDLKTQPHTKGTKFIEMGKYEMEVWYQSPYPEDYTRLPKLYICEFCLRYMKSRTVLLRHIVKCVWRHPPGEEVYRKDKISVWEVDGKKYKQYCQNLCLLAKFFLDHKTLYYDVEPFLFYVMTIYDTEGCHTVGYFSKEKNSFLNYNVSCILTLPPYQRQGYGRLLIDFSYLLTRVEGKIGSPEKPLSDLGLISYRSYWKDVLLGYLCANSNPALSVKDISQEMAISSYDIVSTLQALGMMKYWKGKHIILKKQDVIDEYVERTKRRSTALKEVDRACLRWNPIQPASV